MIKFPKFKKALSLTTAVMLMLLTLAGCSGSDNTSGSTKEDAVSAPEESIQSSSQTPSSGSADTSDGEPSGSKASEAGEADFLLIQYMEPAADQPIAVIKTDLGEIRIMLFPERTPKTVENFITHAKNGYYDGLVFHRTSDDFMIQGGDPLGTGAGGESIYTDEAGNPVAFEDEFVPDLFNFRGALSMANAGPNTNGSQFFIVQATSVPYTAEILIDAGFPEAAAEKYIENGGTPTLDGLHTVFGMVIEGMDVVDAIAARPTGEGPAYRPLEPVTIQTITIENA